MYSTMHSTSKVIKYKILTNKLEEAGLNPSKFHGGEQIMKKLLQLREESRMLSIQDVKNKFEDLLWFRLDDDDKIQLKFNLNELDNIAHQFPSSQSETSDVVNANQIYFRENNETLVINIARLYSCPDRNKIVGFLESIKKRKSNGESVSIIREELNKYTKCLWKREHDYFKKIVKNAEILGIALDQNDYEAFLDQKSGRQDNGQVMESSRTGKRKRRIQEEDTRRTISGNTSTINQNTNECNQSILRNNSMNHNNIYASTNCRDSTPISNDDYLSLPSKYMHLDCRSSDSGRVWDDGRQISLSAPKSRTSITLPLPSSDYSTGIESCCQPLQPGFDCSYFLTQPTTNQFSIGNLLLFQTTRLL